MNSINFKCNISTSDAECPLGVEIWLDNERIYHNAWIKEAVQFEHAISDDDSNRELRWILTGKTDAHTKINENNEIVKDALITISNIEIDDIDISTMAQVHAVYSHNFNGHKDTVQDRFYGVMGCNGTVSFKFITPFYLWLLENM